MIALPRPSLVFAVMNTTIVSPVLQTVEAKSVAMMAAAAVVVSAQRVLFVQIKVYAAARPSVKARSVEMMVAADSAVCVIKTRCVFLESVYAFPSVTTRSAVQMVVVHPVEVVNLDTSAKLESVFLGAIPIVRARSVVMMAAAEVVASAKMVMCAVMDSALSSHRQQAVVILWSV